MLDLEFATLGRRWQANLAASIDLAIRLQFPGPQPRFFANDAASATPLRAGSFTGTVTSGSSCNCSLHSLAPHCHGTHTECIGHLTDNAIAVAGLTPVSPALALLVSVRPESLGSTGAVPGRVHAPDDPVITRTALAIAAARWNRDPWTALVVRTLPNDPDKRYRQYTGPCPAPYFTTDAMHWIVEQDVASLVVDLPSLDRAEDGGALAAHRVYWGLPPGTRDAREARRGGALVTELAYAPDDVPDGLYLLDLHVPAFDADAAPSRPVLYAIKELAP
jgi:kynurenine formamidase